MPALVRGKYRLDDTSQSYIELIGHPETIYSGDLLCLRGGMTAHLEGTLVRDPEPLGLSDIYPEIELPPTDIEIPGEVAGARDAAACAPTGSG